MDAGGEAVGLAAAGAQVVVAAMATDVWPAVKARFAGLFGRGHRTEQRLERSRDRLVADPAVGEAEITGWRVRLADLLEEDPQAAAGLAALIAELTPAVGLSAVQVVRQDIRTNGGASYVSGTGPVTVIGRQGERPRDDRQPG